MSALALLRNLWPFIRPSRQRLAVAMLISLLLTGVEVARPLLVGRFVDSLLAQLHHRPHTHSPFLSQGMLLGWIAAGALLRGMLLTRQHWMAGWIGERVAARMRDALWDQLQHLPLDYTRARGPGQLLLRFTSDARAVQRIVTHGIVQLSQAMLLGAGVLVALALLNFRMALAVAAVVPVFAFIFRRLNPKLRQASRAARRRRSRLSSYLHERLLGMTVVKAFAQQDTEAGNVKELNRDLAKRASRRALVAGQMQGWTTTAVTLGGVVALALAIPEVHAGRLTAGSLVAFYTMLGLLLPVFRRIATANGYFQEGHVSFDRLMGTLALPAERMPENGAPPLSVTRGEVRIEGVSFRFNNGPVVLDNISLQARRGGLMAIVGPHGAGKTTLVELLLRFRQPTSGHILIDGQDIAGISLHSLRAQIGLVTQEAPLFDGTIRDNIAYGLGKDAPETQWRVAAQLAGVDRLVARLPKGWDSRVGRGGRTLSSGQRQRIALARALAVDPPILLLDEPGSAFDPETEQSLADILQKLARDKTVIVIAHRLPPTLKAEQVYVLNGHSPAEE